MPWSLSCLGDAALVLHFEERIDPVVNSCVVRAAAAIREAARGGVRDVVGSYAAVTVHFDPLRTDVDALAERMERIAGEVSRAPGGPGAPPRTVEIPVCYGGGLGPDLPAVARFGGCSEATVVARHAAPAYRVYMLGFLPGFAYLATVEPTIAAPRRDVPRPAGPRRVGRHRGRADRSLPAGGAGRLAAHRTNAPPGLRPGARGALPAARRRRRYGSRR